MKNISFIIPTRNNLEYLKMAYESIRKNLENKNHEVCIADDFSNDSTWDWCTYMMNEDKYLKCIRNSGPRRLGHTILYDKLINEVATNDIVMIFHADMYACPELDRQVEKHITSKTIVSMTRIEPPLHPEGPEKIIKDFGAHAYSFKEKELLNFVKEKQLEYGNKTSNGVFAPWAIYKKDFQSIGGHDPLFAPQSKEDSDIFNRFKLAGFKFIQTWSGFVYHMTCRGSRFKDDTKIKRNPNGVMFIDGRESDEWLKQNERSTRNFIRKWGSYVKHDRYLNPIIPHKYNISFIVKNCSYDRLNILEPWCDKIYIENVENMRGKYINKEQPNTDFNLNNRVRDMVHEVPDTDIVVSFDGVMFNQNTYEYIINMAEIIKDSGNVGSFRLGGNMIITINKLKEYEKNLIKL